MRFPVEAAIRKTCWIALIAEGESHRKDHRISERHEET
jgi:hypothetical protein